jgi:hypothetical protein
MSDYYDYNRIFVHQNQDSNRLKSSKINDSSILVPKNPIIIIHSLV